MDDILAVAPRAELDALQKVLEPRFKITAEKNSERFEGLQIVYAEPDLIVRQLLQQYDPSGTRIKATPIDRVKSVEDLAACGQVSGAVAGHRRSVSVERWPS